MKAIIRQARQVPQVVDHSKLGRTDPARLASLSEVSRFFTDWALPADLAQCCAALGIEESLAAPG